MLSVSSLVKDFYGIDDDCLSLPTVVNRSGIAKLLRIQLSDEEADQLRRSGRSSSANDRHLETDRLSNSFWTGQYLLYFPRV